MRAKTLEQILKVILIVSHNFNKGDRIDHSYQYAVSEVSKEYGVAYQTIGDACRRRLELVSISEFKAMLGDALQGNSTDLRELILRKTPPSYHKRIHEFFSNLENKAENTTPSVPDTFVNYTIQLRKRDSDILRALAELLGGKPEEILADLSAAAIKERMKKAVIQL